jgi:O-antigen ligase
MEDNVNNISLNEIFDFYSIKVVVVLFLLILPALISQLGGFGGNYLTNAEITAQGELSGKILYVLLLILTISLWKIYKLKLVWSKTVYFFFIYLLIGILYSSNTYQVLRGIFVAITAIIMWNVFAQLLLRKIDTLKIINTVSLFLFLFGILELTLWAITPKDYYDYGYMANYVGYFFQPNLLAKLLCIGISLRLFKIILIEKNVSDVVMLMGFAILLLMTGSRTSFFALMISLFISVLLIHDKNLFSYSKWFFIILITVLAFFFFDPAFLQKHNNFGILADSTLVSRYSMWKELVPLMFSHFWLGAGINSFWDPNLFYLYKLNLAGVHNGYLQVFQGLGVIGFILTIFIVWPLLKTLRINRLESKFEALRYSLIGLWIYFAIENLTEGDLGEFRSSLWAILMTLSLVWFYIVKNMDLN